MRAEPRAIEPFGFFTLESLRAGWYLGWRLLVFTVPVVVVPLAIAAVLGASGLWLAGALAALGGMVLAMAVAVRFTNRVAAAWTRREYGRPLPAGVWWSVSWRVLLVSVPLSLLLTPLGLFSEGPLFVSGVLDLVFPVIGLLLAAFYVVGTLQSYGWALSTAVADRFSAAGLDTEPDLLSEPARRDPAPARERPAVPRLANPAPARPAAPSAAAAPAPRPAPARAAAAPGRRVPGRARSATATAAAASTRCPKCGLQETERGSVIGWYCRVCGWREKRG